MQVFISYASADAPFVDRLRREFASAGIEAWTHESVPPGASIIEEITRQLERSDAVIVVLSGGMDRSPWVQSEVAIAISNQLRGGRTRIIPVFAAPRPEIPVLLRDRLCVDLSTSEAFERNIEALLDAVRSPPPVPNCESRDRAREAYLRAAGLTLQLDRVAYEIGVRRRSAMLPYLLAVASSMLTVVAAGWSLLSVTDRLDVASTLTFPGVTISFAAALVSSALSLAIAVGFVRKKARSSAAAIERLDEMLRSTAGRKDSGGGQ